MNDYNKENIMHLKTKSALVLLLGAGVSITLMAQKPADLVGTWAGMATLEGMSEPNELTLVMELEEGKLKGHMTDQYGTMNEALLSEIKLEQGVFSFSVPAVGTDGQELMCLLKMKIDGDSMQGELSIPDWGMNGTWEATKLK
jgi:hypothetical protein